MRDPLWRVGIGVKENAITFGTLGFLAGIIFTFAACSPTQEPMPYQTQLTHQP